MIFDSHELVAVAKGFDNATGGPTWAAVAAAVTKGALNIKQDAISRVSGLAHAPAYPQSITYDLSFSRLGPAAEIGPDKTRRQGALGNILEYGSVKNAPRPHMGPAADAEEPKFAAALEVLAAKATGLG